MAKTATRQSPGKSKAKAAPAKRAKAARRAGSAAVKARKSAAKARPRRAKAAQRFAVNHLADAGFDAGLRSYAAYRDLGVAAATGGMVQAHVIRFLPPCRPEEVSKLHFHDVEFQMIYVLKGWIKSEFAGEGVHTFHAGSCWIQPPRIAHKVLDYSDDCEVLEIVLPAEFDTVTLD